MRAPVAGQVLKIPHKSEGTVTTGQPLIEVGDPRALEVEVDVLSADAVRIPPGIRVAFERWGGEGVLEGVVRVIEPAGFTKESALGVEEQRVWVIVAFISPAAQWQRLGDGNGWAVFALEQGKAVKRSVKIGQRNGLNAQIISGINAGEQVIVHPDDRVREGVSVEAR